MKKLLLLIFLMTISLGYSQTLTGTWKMSPQVGAFGVGPSQGNTGYYANFAADVNTRACFFDDQFVFNADGSFQNVNGTQTWVEAWQGGGDPSCRASVAPHDGSNAATYSYDSVAGTLTLTGVGAYLGLAKAYNGGELSSPSAAPASITYTVSSFTANLITLDINVGVGLWWRFVLAKEGSLPTCTDGIQNGTETGIDCGGTCSACPDSTPPASNPTIAAANAITIYSDSGTLAGTAVPVDTFRTVWSGANLDNVVLSGNAALKYTNLGFVGIETVNNQINATGMNIFHIDVYTATATTFAVKLVDFGANGGYQGGDDAEHELALTTQVGWNSYNILLSDFTGLTTRAHIAQIILAGSGTAYVDNMYFGNVEVQVAPVLSNFTVPTKQIGDAAFTITAPTSTSAGSFTYTSSNTDVATISGSTITIVGVGTSTITATQAASGNYLSGTITANFVVTAQMATAPTTAAPTPPARNAWDVVSVFTDSANYNVQGADFYPYWGQPAGYIAPSIVQVGTTNDNTLLYQNLTYQGLQFNTPINVLSMTKLHLDVWTPNSSTLDVLLIGGGENGVVVNPTMGEWTSFDIDMSNYAGRTLNNIIQMMFRNTTPAGGKVYIDNIYYWRPATSLPAPTITNFTVPNKTIGDESFQLVAPTSNSNGAFTYAITGNTGVATISGNTVTILATGTTTITATQEASGGYGSGVIAASFVVSFPPPATAAPTPTVPADRVLSVFSDAYNNEGSAYYPSWGQNPPVTVTQLPIAGNNTLKIDNLSYQGVQLTSIDVSAMTTLHLDLWTPNCTTFDFFLINQALPAGQVGFSGEISVTLSPTQSGWNSIDIPMSSFAGLELNHIEQFKFVGAPSGSVVYIDNIYFTKPTSRSIAPTTTAVVNYCKGAVATALTASGFSGNSLKWYTVGGTVSVPTYTLIPTGAPTPATATVASPSKKYAVSQVLSDGSESPKANITVNVLALPTEVLGTITSNTTSTTTTTGFVAATTAVGQFVGTSTQVSYRIPTFTGTGLTYYWTVPTGVNIVSQIDNVLTVNFLNVSSGIGAVGNITVQAQNTSGCRTAAKSVALSKVLPTAPSSIKMTIGSSATTITSFAPYMGTDTVLTLTANPSTTATSYVWELPTGVNLRSGATTTSGVTSGTLNVITVDFLGVTKTNTSSYTTTPATGSGVLTHVLRIGVKSRNGVGVSTTSNATTVNPGTTVNAGITSTAKLLTLTAIAPAAPTKITLTNPAFSGTAATTAITVISKYIGTTTELLLTATASPLASSYEWELPSWVNFVSAADASNRVITVNFAGNSTLAAPAGVTSYYFGARAKNGIGYSETNNATSTPQTSSTAKLLKVTTSLPAAVKTVTGQITNLCPGQTVNYTFTASALANTYTITAPANCRVTSSSNLTNVSNVLLSSSDLNFTVEYPISPFVITSSQTDNKTITIQSENGVGNSLPNKVLTLDTKALAAVGTPTNSYVNPITEATSATLFGKCATQTISVPKVLGATSYVWTLQNGAVIVGNATSFQVVIDFSQVATPTSTTTNIVKVKAQNACNSTAEKLITLTWDGIAPCPDSGINKEIVPTAVAGEVSIYPNPTRDNFTLELTASQVGEMSMTIYNINGAMVRTKNVQLTEGNNVINEDVSSLSSGIYFVQIYNASNGETVVKKLVKE
jgi:hypothetical protein